MLCNFISEFYLHNRVNWPTRVTRSTITTIHHIYTHFSSGICCVVDNTISDHRKILFDTTLHESNSNSEGILSHSRNFNESSIRLFQSALSRESWNELYTIIDVDNAFKYFYNIILFYFNLYFPIGKHFNSYISKSWVNDSVRRSSRQLKDFYTLTQSAPEYKTDYLKAKQQHRKLVETTKREFYQNKIMNSDNSIKKVWRVISELTQNKIKASNTSINVDGDVISNPHKVANTFNAYFKSVPEEIVSNLSASYDLDVESNINDDGDDFLLYPFTEDELYELLILKLKNKYSSGPDDIPCFLLRRILCIIVKPFTYLINLSFCYGKFPQILKLSKVTPIYKKGCSFDISNYRPVTVPYGFALMYEYCFLNRLLGYLNLKNVISDHQHGFRSNRSTSTAISYFYDELVSYIEAGECPVGIFCDLSRAFDCVQHNLLLSKLSKYNIKGTPLQWLKSYLSNRTQYVRMFYYEKNRK